MFQTNSKSLPTGNLLEQLPPHHPLSKHDGPLSPISVRTNLPAFKKPRSISSPTSIHFSPRKEYSLADQYLDTRPMNDDWREDCEKIIRWKQFYLNSSHCTNLSSKVLSKISRPTRTSCLRSKPFPHNMACRSTRSHPMPYIATTGPIDIPASTRNCFSCRSTETKCWRYANGTIFCNSCGLR
jgi:hypothetical protein